MSNTGRVIALFWVFAFVLSPFVRAVSYRYDCKFREFQADWVHFNFKALEDGDAYFLRGAQSMRVSVRETDNRILTPSIVDGNQIQFDLGMDGALVTWITYPVGKDVHFLTVSGSLETKCAVSELTR